MIKEKKSYSAPRMEMQVFVPDAFATMCNISYTFTAVCDLGRLQSGVVDSDDTKLPDGSQNTHNSGGCGSSDSYTITWDSNSQVWKMYENHTDPVVETDCTIPYSDIHKYTENYSLEWTTTGTSYYEVAPNNKYGYEAGKSVAVERTWHHKGHIDLTNWSKSHS